MTSLRRGSLPPERRCRSLPGAASGSRSRPMPTALAALDCHRRTEILALRAVREAPALFDAEVRISRGKRIEQRHASPRNVGDVTGDKRQSVYFGCRCQEPVDKRQWVGNVEPRPDLRNRTRRQEARDLQACFAFARTIGRVLRLVLDRLVVLVRFRDVFRQGQPHSSRSPLLGFEQPNGQRTRQPDRAFESRK